MAVASIVVNYRLGQSPFNANHPIERNYGNSVRFLAKIPTVPRPNRRATVYFGTQLISVGCILLKKSQCGPYQPSRFLSASPAFFYAKCPSKNILQVGRSVIEAFTLGLTPIHAQYTGSHSNATKRFASSKDHY